ncbi:MerR family DNA-binding transcriptional regulator, partial [Pseudomonas aeruginosa]|uniref:MerR family DNA-binding transcriptional regulator n=1 Tax=Pseudomonas aeruginosa TaxID=287 RepID=UPI0031B6E569
MQLIECAKAAGVTPDTLRHYLRVGLVVPDGRGTNGYRVAVDHNGLVAVFAH